MGTKVCSKCKVKQPINCFYKDSKNKDGHSGWCAGCYVKYQKKYKKKRRENRQKIWRKMTHNPDNTSYPVINDSDDFDIELM